MKRILFALFVALASILTGCNEEPIADVDILKQDLVVQDHKWSYLNPTSLHYCNSIYKQIGIRFTVRITPKDGSAPTDIYKTFKLNEIDNVEDNSYHI